MSNLEATIAELRRAQARPTTSLAQFMEEVNQPQQEELFLENEVDVLAISMAKLAKSRIEYFMEETRANIQFQSIPLKILEEMMTPKAISHTQSDVKIEQHPHMKEMSIGELMA